MAAGTGVFRLLGAMRMGEPVRGPRAVKAGSAAIPGEVDGKKRGILFVLIWCSRNSSYCQC